jgi:hypothetical protein
MVRVAGIVDEQRDRFAGARLGDRLHAGVEWA